MLTSSSRKLWCVRRASACVHPLIDVIAPFGEQIKKRGKAPSDSVTSPANTSVTFSHSARRQRQCKCVQHALIQDCGAACRFTRLFPAVLYDICDKHRLCAQANFLWAYAALGKPMGSACLEALAAHAHKQLPRFSAQQLADMMWAFARFRHSPGAPLLQGCEAHATCIARAINARNVVRCCSVHQQQPTQSVHLVKLCVLSPASRC